MDINKEVIKIVQITDAHLSKDSLPVLGVNTNLSFAKIINNLQVDLLDADAIFLTGDLSQDESIGSYEIIANSLKGLNKKIFWIPGNHDSVDKMKEVFSKSDNFIEGRVLLTHWWDFIFLNTKKSGQESGFLSENEISFLSSELANLRQARAHPIAVVMHHHPIEVKTPLIDNYMLQDNDIFLNILTN